MRFSDSSTSEQIATAFVKDHKEMEKDISKLSSKQREQIIFDSWTTKDIIAHLAAWNFEWVKEIDRVLQDRATWHKKYETDEQEAEFNRKAIAKRKDKSWDEIIKEWEQSFSSLINRIKRLTPRELKHQSGNDVWDINGKPVTVLSLFDYEHEGAGHESGHSKQIKEKFNLN